MKTATTTKKVKPENKRPLLELVEDYINDNRREIVAADERINKDFLDSFRWGYFEHKYKYIFQNEYVTYLKRDIDEGFDDVVKDWLKTQITAITKELMSGRYVKRSSSQSANIAYSIEMESKADLLVKFQYWLSRIEEGAPIK